MHENPITDMEQTLIELVRIFPLLPEDMPTTIALKPVYERAVDSLVLLDHHRTYNTSSYDWRQTFNEED